MGTGAGATGGGGVGTTPLAGSGSALLGAGLLSAVANLLMLTGPLFMLQVYDRVLSSGSVPTLVALVALVAGLYLFLGLFELLRARLLSRFARREEARLRGPVFRAVMSLRSDSAGRDATRGARPSGDSADLGAAPLRDLEKLRAFLSGPGPFALFDMPWAPLYLGVVFLLHAWLGWFALAAAGVLVVLALLNEVLTRRPFADAGGAGEEAQAFADEARRASGPARAMGMTGVLEAAWRGRKGRASALSAAASDRAGLFTAATKAVRLLAQSGILALGAYLAILGQVTPGAMIAASILMGRALAPVEQAISHWRAFQEARRARKRLARVLAASAVDEPRTALPAPRGRLSVHGLAALLPGRDQPLVQGVSFDLEPGDGVGVIGPSGAGKTTLVKALLGLWPHARGDVRIDGAEIGQWAPEALGRHVGYLPQEPSLLPGTVAENIGRFDAQVSDEEVVAAAQTAGAHALILSLPDGYDTLLGAAGAPLSAGQRQRVALARALLRDPCLLLLDEPNANLDVEGDQALASAIAAARARGACVIVVAHRPSALGALGHVLFLREGRQEAFGPKDEVLRTVTQPVRANTTGAAAGRRAEAQGAGAAAPLEVVREKA